MEHQVPDRGADRSLYAVSGSERQAEQ